MWTAYGLPNIGDTMHTATNISKIVSTALVVLAFTACHAVAAERTGREVVEQTCSACHADGKDGAPKIGDLAAWGERLHEGFGKLAVHAIAGIGKMPAHGGQPNLSDLEISRAIAFMATGGRAADPGKPYSAPSTGTGEKLVGNHCVKCHGPGLEGAPRIEQFSDWKPRLQNGIDALVQSAIAGHKGMPSRAGLAYLSDTDLRNAAIFMIIQSATYKANK